MNWRKLIVILVILLNFCSASRACLNHYYYGVDKEGKLHVVNEESGFHMFNSGFYITSIQYEMQDILQKMIVERSYMALSDYSICLMQAGKKEEALKILQELYSKYPGEYQLASNLGTAYELNGQNDSALKYIRRGMELNPAEHEGSEWVHVSILETKIQLAKNPDYLKTYRVLNLTEAQLNDTVVASQIELQLRERFPFCPGPDLIMAQLITDLADITMNTSSLELAKGFYGIGIYYFGDSSEVSLRKQAECIALLKKYETVAPGGRDTRVEALSYRDYINFIGGASNKMDWTGLPSDPDVLLQYVDLTMSSSDAYDLLKKSIGTSDGDSEVEAGVVEDEGKGEYTSLLFLLPMLLSMLIYAFALRK